MRVALSYYSNHTSYFAKAMTAIPPHPAHALLDVVDWSTVEHADGIATDLPQVLKQLTLEKEERRTVHSLFRILFKQWIPTTAAWATIPYLLELIEQEILQSPIVAIELLLYIATVNPINYALEKYDTSVLWSDDPKETDWWQITCYEAVEASVPIFRARLKHTTCVWTKDACAYALAFFPRRAEGSIALLLEEISNIETLGRLMDYLLYLELLVRRSPVRYTFEELVHYTTHENVGIRIATFMLVAKRPLTVEEMYQYLTLYFEGMALELYDEEFLEECDYDKYFVAWLFNGPWEEKQVILSAGTQFLTKIGQHQLELDDYVWLMLKTIHKRYGQVPLETIALQEFNVETLQILHFLCEPLAWAPNKYSQNQLSYHLKQVGLPHTRETLTQYLAQA